MFLPFHCWQSSTSIGSSTAEQFTQCTHSDQFALFSLHGSVPHNVQMSLDGGENVSYDGSDQCLRRLSTKLHFYAFHCFGSEDDDDHCSKRNSLSQPLCHYQGSCNRFQEVCFLSIKMRHSDMKLLEFNRISSNPFGFSSFFTALMDRLIASKKVATKEAKKTEGSLK